MSYVQEFFLLTIVTTAAVMAIVVVSPAHAAYRLARGLYYFTLVIGGAALLITLVRALGLSRVSVIPAPLFRVLLFRGWVTIGAALAAVAMAGWSRPRAFVTSPDVVRAVCVSVALSFLTIELGKWRHDAEILTFFLQSGLPGWFRHVVMGIELLCAVGLLIARPATIVPAAVVAIGMMAGAIATHARNGDAFEDSLDAFHLLVLLLCVLVLGSVLGWRQLTWLPNPSRRSVSLP